ncbi:peptidoglycan-binding domain-containing protein [Phaeovulum sp. W22_SRMD_FR3]|uniref:peptidoglycan-binding domain-containing protein n=1 Tax=Phaeovulum sp. W22_SRMD_FR3 TaxID=3240274 RepID=UPI003F96573B
MRRKLGRYGSHAVTATLCAVIGVALWLPARAQAEEMSLAGQIELKEPTPQPGVCYVIQTKPAVFETTTEQIQVSAERRDPKTGEVIRPARYRTETRQRMVSARVPQWFRTPCLEQLTDDGIATLQRALQARGVFRGEITGRYDRATQRAVHVWQKARGLDSGKLSFQLARELGLVPWETPPEPLTDVGKTAGE